MGLVALARILMRETEIHEQLEAKRYLFRELRVYWLIGTAGLLIATTAMFSARDFVVSYRGKESLSP